jgi:hypothetical protein
MTTQTSRLVLEDTCRLLPKMDGPIKIFENSLLIIHYSPMDKCIGLDKMYIHKDPILGEIIVKLDVILPPHT